MNIREMLLHYLDEFDYPVPQCESGIILTSERGSEYDFPLRFEPDLRTGAFTLWVDVLTFPADYLVSDELLKTLDLVNAEIPQGTFVENGTGILFYFSSNHIPLSVEEIDGIVNQAVNQSEDYYSVFLAVQRDESSPKEALAKQKEKMALRR